MERVNFFKMIFLSILILMVFGGIASQKSNQLAETNIMEPMYGTSEKSDTQHLMDSENMIPTE